MKKKIQKPKRCKEDICKEHLDPRHFFCTDCEFWICGTCLAYYHKSHETLYLGEIAYEKEMMEIEENGSNFEKFLMQSKEASKIDLFNYFLNSFHQNDYETEIRLVDKSERMPFEDFSSRRSKTQVSVRLTAKLREDVQ